MADIKAIAAYLAGCTNGTASGCPAGTGLTFTHQRIFNHRRNPKKAEMVKELAEFYADETNILDIWSGLSECERDFVGYVVRYEGREYIPATKEYADKHNLKLEYTNRWGRTEKLFDNSGFSRYDTTHLKFLHLLARNFPDTKTVLLFPSGGTCRHSSSRC